MRALKRANLVPMFSELLIIYATPCTAATSAAAVPLIVKMQ
jgi:hypothetical protein